MKKPQKLSKEAVALFKPLLMAEYTAFYFYRNAANYCKGVGYFKAAAYFEKESADELEHAKKLQDFLVDWNVHPELPTVLPPDEDITNLIDVIEDAYAMEYALYEEYDKSSVKALDMGEVCVFDLFQFFRGVQNKSVAEYSDMLNMLEGVEGNKIELLLLEEKLFN